MGHAGAAGRPAERLPPPPERQGYLVLKVSRCRGGARLTVATACFDGSDGQGIDALADISGGDLSSDEALSTGVPDEPRRKPNAGVARASRSSRGGRRRGHGRGDRRGRGTPGFGDDEETDGSGA